MNIKIATFFFGNNYGALLQCYCLKKFLQNHYQNRFIDHFNYQPKKLIFREEFSPIFKKNPLKVLDGLLRFKNLRKWKKDNISTKPIFLKKMSNEKNHISVYGSDEIWNFSNPFFGYDDFFFGKYDENSKISYAASFGAAKKDKLNVSLKYEIKNLLNKFSNISVRDENSSQILKSEFGIKSEIVLDPIFLIENIFLDIKIKNDESKCIIYGNYFSKPEIKKITDYCKKNKLKILSIGYYNNWTQNNIKLDPFEFLNEIKNSKIIFTSMFHGIQFAVKYNKNFWFSNDPYRKAKLDYFLKELGLNKRIIEENSNFDEEIDYTNLENKLKTWKISSKEFLLDSINSIGMV